MDKKKFEKIMDEWAAHEMEAAPDLEPSPEVYRKLEEKKRRPRFAMFSWPVRLAAAGIAAALIVLVIVLQPPREMEPLLGLRKADVPEKLGREESADRMQVLGEEKVAAEAEKKTEAGENEAKKAERAKTQETVAKEEKDEAKKEVAEKIKQEEAPAKAETARKILELEEGKEADKEAMVRPQASKTRPRMKIEPIAAAAAPAAAVSERLEFQFQPEGSEAIEKQDIKVPQEEILALSSEDNYRLVLQLPQVRYVYVFQVVGDTHLVRLFPNAGYSPSQNPLQGGETIIIPTPPDWFFVGKDDVEVSLYVVTSSRPLQGWDEVYADYSRSGSEQEKQKRAHEWLDRIETARQDPDSQVSVRTFKFTIN